MGLHPPRDGLKDGLRHPLGVPQYLTVPEADHLPSKRFEESRPLPVVILILQMLAAIHFDRQLSAPAGKIDDVGADDMLPGEPRAIAAEDPPQNALGLGG